MVAYTCKEVNGTYKVPYQGKEIDFTPPWDRIEMRKGILEYCILSILDKKEAYPSEILETLKDAKLIVVEGTLYPLLTRLKNMELLSYRWEESQSGPPRKYFTLTKMGKAFLEELDNTWSELSEAVNKITNISTK
jgi:PadR family transcriptional regulator PadR